MKSDESGSGETKHLRQQGRKCRRLNFQRAADGISEVMTGTTKRADISIQPNFNPPPN